MKYQLNYDKDGYQDSIIIEGLTIEEIKSIADSEIEIRGWDESCIRTEKLK